VVWWWDKVFFNIRKMKKKRNHLRTCKRCGRIFRTPFKHGVYCIDCYFGKKNGNHKVFNGFLREQKYSKIKKQLDERIKRGRRL